MATRSGTGLSLNSPATTATATSQWRWYSNLAPISWLVQDLGELTEQVSGGEMPPSKYTLIHSGASLDSEEKAQLVAALTKLYANDPPPLGSGG